MYKTLWFCIILLVSSPSIAQQVTEEVFPIGGLSFFTTDNAIKRNQVMTDLGLNVIYETNENYGIASSFEDLNSSLTVYPAEKDKLVSFIGTKGDEVCTDVRFFLTSTDPDGKLMTTPGEYGYDVQFNWLGKAGAIIGNGEYRIGAAQLAPGSSSYYLKDLDNTKWFSLPANTRKGYLDFIYRIDKNLDYATLGNSDVIYTLEYTLHVLEGSTPAEITGSANITVGHYLNYADPTEHASIKTFANKQYAVYRMQVDIPEKTADDETITFKRLEFKLKKTSESRNIFVRGLRVRNERGDQLLRGQLDGDIASPDSQSLYGTFEKIKKELRGPDSQSTAWARTKAITAGTEIIYPQYRAYAYVTKKWREWCARSENGGTPKDIYCILAHSWVAEYHNYQWLYPIFKDETGQITPPVMGQERINMYLQKREVKEQPHNLIFPGDAIKASAKNHQTGGVRDFLTFGKNVTGLGSNNFYGSTSLTQYNDYTTRFQLKTEDRSYLFAALAAYPSTTKAEEWQQALQLLQPGPMQVS